jgi:hypothetical protein
MEFLLYLTPIGNEIMKSLAQARFTIRENIGLCSNKNIFGYVDTPKKFVVCTKNIKNGGWDLRHYVNETVYHEAVHAAQNCKGSIFGIPEDKMPLPANKLQDVKNSVKTNRNNRTRMREHESYWMEDKPEKVKYVVQKYCL